MASLKANVRYCGSYDTLYVGNMKGVGRIYQQTFIDTYAKRRFRQALHRATPITAADLLNDRVVPFYIQRGKVSPRATIAARNIAATLVPPNTSSIGARRYRPFAHQDQEPANEWHR